MSNIDIPTDEVPYIEALRSLIRTGAMAAPNLESSPLIDMPVVLQQTGAKSNVTKRAHAFIQTLHKVIRQRLSGKEAETANILFGFDAYSGMPIQDRYRAVAKLYNSYWTWENYRKEPLTRHLLAVYLALKREAVLIDISKPVESTQNNANNAQFHSANKVLIVKNITREGPGLLEKLLNEVALGYEVIDLSKGETFPDPTRFAALVVLGGPDSANDKTAKMTLELQQIHKAFDAGVPYLGICLGLQIATKLLGGKVVQSPVKEIGLSSPDGVPYKVSLTSVALTALGKKDPLFVGLRDDFRVFQLHGETIDLTKSMQLLATGRDCPNQIVKFRRNIYGIQSHFELTRRMLEEWLEADPDLSALKEQEVLDEFDTIEELYTITGLSLLRNFLYVAGILNYA